MNQNPLKHVPPYNPMLKESINRFLTEYRKGVTDFSDFTSIFSRMLHSFPDPPLEIVWFYSALEFHTIKLGTGVEPSRRVSVAKDLFQLLVSCSVCCGSMKRIGLLAPLVFELYHLAIQEKQLKSEVEGLLEGVISYCSIFGSKVLHGDGDGDDGMEILEADFVDVIAVWMVDQQLCGVGDCVKGFFPFVSEQFQKGIKMGCEIGFLAGVVMCEALLLKMCLKFESGITKAEQEKKLQGSAVRIITGFRNFYFLDTLFRMILEPVLPVISLLGSENEVLLKEALYNAVMMIEYSFINLQAEVSLYANSLKDFAVTWLFVADLAIRSARYEKKTLGPVMDGGVSRMFRLIGLIIWLVTGKKVIRGKPYLMQMPFLDPAYPFN